MDDQREEAFSSSAVRGMGKRKETDSTFIDRTRSWVEHRPQQLVHSTKSSTEAWEIEGEEGQEEMNLLLGRNFGKRKCSKMIIFFNVS